MITRRAVLLFLVGLLLGLPVWATDNTPPEGFVSLFNGKDLLGWKAPTGDNGHWKVDGPQRHPLVGRTAQVTVTNAAGAVLRAP